jgi:hypothetical protein
MAETRDEDLVRGVVQCLLAPWLQESAFAFQDALQSCPLPDSSTAELITVPEGGCLFFADGLRYDLGMALRDRLQAGGCRVKMGYRWAALPTVTATAKPAITPIALEISGDELPEDFSPVMTDSQKSVNAKSIRDKLEGTGFQILKGGLEDWPASDSARGWMETGKVDHRGHQMQGDLPNILDDEIERLANQIINLLEAGWNTVRVVTDHGWLYLPLGLPKVDLPKHLTSSKWSRCATIVGDSSVDVPTGPWHWNTARRFATGPGVACFTSSNCYAHGGLSIQECLTPDMQIENVGGAGERASIQSVTWKGMRCFVEAGECGEGVQADLRLRGPTGQSVAASVKALDQDGTTSLLLTDDEHESEDLVVVLLGVEGAVLAQHKTKVGIDS